MSMRNDSLEYLTSEHASLKPLRIYLFDGEIYECIPSTDRENFWLRNLKTGEKERLETALTITRKDDIRDITDAYIREHPDYAAERLDKAREALSQSEDYFEAQRLLEPLAEGGDPEAQYLMAYCYTKASNPDLFPPKYVNIYLEKAAAQGHLKAQYFLAQNYRIGFNGTEDPVLSAKWYEEAAKQGHAKAAAFTGLNHETGVKGLYPADPKTAFHWYQISAEADDPLGLYFLGLAYENGIGTDADRRKAMECYRKGAELKHKKCAFRYAYIQDPVYGFPEFSNGEAALEWYHKAKHLRDERASRYLGLHYANGTCGLDINRRKARELFLDGASLGDAPCAAEAGRDYLYGDHGARQDLHQAYRLCSQAAEAGDTTGMLLLAHYYLLRPQTEENREENLEKSLEWAKKAKAAGGNAEALLEEAQKRLGELRKEERKKHGLFGRKRK